jgi:hypothetical protein
MPKAPAEIRSLARAQTKLAIRTLTGICGSKAAPAAARVSAASALLDRGWGRVPQAQAGEDGDGSIEVTVRHLCENRVLPSARPMIEARAVFLDENDGDERSASNGNGK